MDIQFRNAQTSRLALEYCNSLSRGRIWGDARDLGDPSIFADWAESCGWPLEVVELDSGILGSFLALRLALIGIFDRIASGEAPEQNHIAILNAEIAQTGASMHIVAELHNRWRLEDKATSSLERLRHAITKDAIELLTEDTARIKRCRARDCLLLFYDASKNRSRRWCSMEGCGSRAKMRRHRAHRSY